MRMVSGVALRQHLAPGRRTRAAPPRAPPPPGPWAGRARARPTARDLGERPRLRAARSGARRGAAALAPERRSSRTQCRNASTRVFVPASPAWPSVSMIANGFPSMRPRVVVEREAVRPARVVAVKSAVDAGRAPDLVRRRGGSAACSAQNAPGTSGASSAHREAVHRDGDGALLAQQRGHVRVEDVVVDRVVRGRGPPPAGAPSARQRSSALAAELERAPLEARAAPRARRRGRRARRRSSRTPSSRGEPAAAPRGTRSPRGSRRRRRSPARGRAGPERLAEVAAHHVRRALHDRAEPGALLVLRPAAARGAWAGRRSRRRVAAMAGDDAVVLLHRRAERDVRRLDAARGARRARRGRTTSRSSPSPRKSVAKNGNSPFSWNASASATRRRPACARRRARRSSASTASARSRNGSGAPSGSFRVRVPAS